jgi:hypothetical protein
MLKLGTPVSPIAGTQGETSHLAINAYQSNPNITVGTRFHLGLEITPMTGMHVYAPGARDLGYRVIRLELDAPDFIRLPPLQYPASEIYHFEPLDERVPVYQDRFTLVQEVIVEASPEASETLASLDALTLTGRLDYQACDDRICFDPASVPLTWTLTVEPLDRQRASQPTREEPVGLTPGVVWEAPPRAGRRARVTGVPTVVPFQFRRSSPCHAG